LLQYRLADEDEVEQNPDLGPKVATP
jgi:hypothetical protein